MEREEGTMRHRPSSQQLSADEYEEDEVATLGCERRGTRRRLDNMEASEETAGEKEEEAKEERA